MSDKPQVRIEDWFLIKGRLYGKAYDHPRFEDGTLVRTSTVISEPGDEPAKEGDVLETRNTFYELGKKGVQDDRNRQSTSGE